jgi:hypothetical protein
MMICPKCLQVYQSSAYQYCFADGQKTLDTASEEAKPYIKKLMKKLEKESGNNG